MNHHLTPSLLLTTEHPSSSHGVPVLVHRPTGDAYGPGDIANLCHTGLQPVAHLVCRLVKHKPEALEAAKQFCSQWPDGPQP